MLAAFIFYLGNVIAEYFNLERFWPSDEEAIKVLEQFNTPAVRAFQL